MDQVHVRGAEGSDLDWLAEHDGHLDRAQLERKVAAGEVLVAEIDGQRAGLLRLDHLWSRIPFIAQIRVLEPARRRGVGRTLVAFACEQARRDGVHVLLSSSQADEPAPQAWHRAAGFEECGFVAGINEGDVDEIVFRIAL